MTQKSPEMHAVNNACNTTCTNKK